MALGADLDLRNFRVAQSRRALGPGSAVRRIPVVLLLSQVATVSGAIVSAAICAGVAGGGRGAGAFAARNSSNRAVLVSAEQHAPLSFRKLGAAPQRT